jgi:hypothetical protein
MGMAAMYIVSQSQAETEAALRGQLAPILMRFGIRDWSFRGQAGAQIPITSTSIEQVLPFAEIGFEVADRCFDLYLADVIRPLAARQARLSAPGLTERLTSQMLDVGSTPPTPSSPSSRKTTGGKPSEDQAP